MTAGEWERYAELYRERFGCYPRRRPVRGRAGIVRWEVVA